MSSEPSDGIQRRLAEVIQLQLLRFVRAKLERVGPIPDAVKRDAPVLRAWTAFLQEPERPWTLAALAEVAGLSRSAFAARFKTIVGGAPKETIRTLRLCYAADMLSQSEAPVSEIALKAGYRSDVALMRAFRCEFGLTPVEWRRKRADSRR